jgi:hypothetical protein
VLLVLQGDDFRLSMLYICGLVHKSKELLTENFVSAQVQYAPSECNRVSHELAVFRKRVARVLAFRVGRSATLYNVLSVK